MSSLNQRWLEVNSVVKNSASYSVKFIWFCQFWCLPNQLTCIGVIFYGSNQAFTGGKGGLAGKESIFVQIRFVGLLCVVPPSRFRCLSVLFYCSLQISMSPANMREGKTRGAGETDRSVLLCRLCNNCTFVTAQSQNECIPLSLPHTHTQTHTVQRHFINIRCSKQIKRNISQNQLQHLIQRDTKRPTMKGRGRKENNEQEER